MRAYVRQVNERVARESEVIQRIRCEAHKVIIGQENLLDRMLMALLSNQHLLIEGVPGLAKSLSVTTLARMIQASFRRLQFTPDLLPADLIGTLIYNPRSGEFTVKQGPIFAQIILADEINRAPAKVQSALLAFSAVKSNDKVGLIGFSESVEIFIAPAKGHSHALRLIRALLCFKPRQTCTNILHSLEYFCRITTRRCLVFLVSDFLQTGFEKALRVAAKQHDLIAVSIKDPAELRLPNVGLIQLEDAETRRLVQFDTSRREIRRKYAQLSALREEFLNDLFRRSAIDKIDVFTNGDYVHDFIRFFRTRHRPGLR